jgi:hypothetical protein
MDIFYISLTLALLLIAVVGMGYLLRLEGPVAKRRRKPQHWRGRSRRTRRFSQD